MSDPTSLWEFMNASWRDHVVVFGISTWAGIVSHLHRRLSHKGAKLSVVIFAADVCMSGLAGMLMFWMCYAAGVDPIVTAIGAGIAGHSAPRTLWLIERRFFQGAGLLDD
jgi:hypothetical protein